MEFNEHNAGRMPKYAAGVDVDLVPGASNPCSVATVEPSSPIRWDMWWWLSWWGCARNPIYPRSPWAVAVLHQM